MVAMWYIDQGRSPEIIEVPVHIPGQDIILFRDAPNVDFIEGFRYWEYPAHMNTGFDLVFESTGEDYRLVLRAPLEVRAGDSIFIPSLGMSIVSLATPTELWVNQVDLGRIHVGMSGQRVLSADFRHVLGFVSRVEENQLVIIRTRLAH
jgi:hypothetical protein